MITYDANYKINPLKLKNQPVQDEKINLLKMNDKL